MSNLTAVASEGVTQEGSPSQPKQTAVIHISFDKCDEIFEQHRQENPNLYRKIKQDKKIAALDPSVIADSAIKKLAQKKKPETILNQPLRGATLQHVIRQNQAAIKSSLVGLEHITRPRTAASNQKSPYQTIDEERKYRAYIVAPQLKAWRAMLPDIIKQFAKLSDYRRATHIRHKMVVLMAFGLFAFIFKLSSRREMNRELTSPMVMKNLRQLFPDLDSIPHADTLFRVLEKLDPKEIEKIQIGLIKKLIKHKKFKQLLIQDHLPISVDGTQKLYRQGLLQDDCWCERRVGLPENDDHQQYIYVLEANITLKNGLSIPLMTEYLYREHNQLSPEEGKQDSENTAFERLTERLKKYFPRLKILIMADALFATQPVIRGLTTKNWSYLIKLPKRKLVDFTKLLNAQKNNQYIIPGQPVYRGREQFFYWINDVVYGNEGEFTVHLASCEEHYQEVNKKTGEIEKKVSTHRWICSLPIKLDNLHELCNLGARKQQAIEDGINTEKNRGYHYKHAYAYSWNAMQGTHYLMRLAHAINELSLFTKYLKAYSKSLGISAVLKVIKETLSSPWLSLDWHRQQNLENPHLYFQME